MTPRTGHVLFASDDRGFAQLGVAIHSLVSSADPSRALRISVFTGCGALTSAHREDLRSIVSRHSFASLDIHDVDAYLEPHRAVLKREGSGWGVMIWARCLIGEIFAVETQPIVYLDIDTFVCRDLGELYDLDMTQGANGRSLVLGAVCEECRETGVCHDPIWSSPLFDARAERYFNSGCLVMNVTAFREERLFDKLVTWYAAHKHEVIRPDQDALNCLFWDRTYFLHPRYNHCDGWLERQRKYPLAAAHWRGNAPRDVLEAVSEPAVLHFWGPKKPWQWNHRPEGARYAQAMREIGLPTDALCDKTLAQRLTRGFFACYHGLLRRHVVWRLSRLGRG